jgi:dipeptide/tripeptide permease
LLQVGAGFVLALGFSVAAFAAYSRYGNTNIHFLASRCSVCLLVLYYTLLFFSTICLVEAAISLKNLVAKKD